MPIPKIVKIFAGVTVVGLVLLYFYYRSRATVATGVQYNLANADIYALTGNTTTPPTTTATAGAPPRFAVDSRTEPAASLIATYEESFLLSASTMNRIKERIGYASNIFNGQTTAQRQKIGAAFSAKFDINPNSLLSYPLWLPDKAPALLPALFKKSQVLPFEQLRTSTKQEFLIVPEWFNFASYGFNANDAAEFESLKRFFVNCKNEILRLQDAVRFEAVQYLRNQGWRFTDYGDIN
jgi:hypothetical protein